MEGVPLPTGISVKQKDNKSIGLAIGLENIYGDSGFRKHCISVVEMEQKRCIFSVHVKNPICSTCLKLGVIARIFFAEIVKRCISGHNLEGK